MTLGVEKLQSEQLGIPSLLVQSYPQGLKKNLELHSYMQACLSLSTALPPKEKKKMKNQKIKAWTRIETAISEGKKCIQFHIVE